MNLTKCLGLLAGAGAMSLTSSGLADSEVTNAELAARLAAAEARIAELTNPDARELTEARAEEVRNLVYEVLADADTRASLLSSNLASGYENGFVIKSDDGNFSLRLNGLAQVRYALVIRDDNSSAQPDSTRWGFENPRTKLTLSGHVGDRSWTYMIEADAPNEVDPTTGAAGANSGDFEVLNAWIQKTFDGGTYVRAGQFKAPFLREELIYAGDLLAVERSLVNETFNQDYSQGVEFGYRGDGFRAMVMWHDGAGQRNSPSLAYDTELGLAARVEAILAGAKDDWSRFDSFTSKKGNDYAILLGGAINYEKDEYGTSAPPAIAGAEQERLGLTADVQVEGNGWNVFGAFVYSSVDDDVAMGVDADQYAFVVQGGIYFTDTLEGFVRYEYGDADSVPANFGVDPATGMVAEYDELQLVTLGVNAYMNENIKWTTDVGFSFDEVSPVWSSTQANWASDGIGDSTQVVVRSQLQLSF